jgi:prepilin-type N-terminal cleavage/methylation domain-containing protein
MGVRRREAGFSLTELMFVVLIVGILSAVATPYVGRDRVAREGRDFVSTVARDMQRARVQAVSDRLPIRAFVFRDRVEFRSAIAGATPGAAPRAPTTTDPTFLVLQAKPGLDILDVQKDPSPAPAGQILTTATFAQVEFSAVGQAQLVGQPALTSAYLFVRNLNLTEGHPDRDFRIDVNALTGFVGLREGWP